MALFEGDNWSFTVEEWWSQELGNEVYHDYEPSWNELELQADTLTGHIEWYDEEGNVIQEQYFQLESDDGWYPDDLEAEVDDAVSYYESQ